MSAATLTRFTKPVLHFMDLMDAVVHEVGHSLTVLPLGGNLSIKIAKDGSGVHESNSGLLSLTPLAPVVMVISYLFGYATPILLGLSLMFVAFNTDISISGWWFIIFPLFLLSSLAQTTGLIPITLLSLPSAWVGVVLVFMGVPGPFNETPITGVDLAGFVLTFIGVVLLLSIRSLFTLLVAVVWFAVLAIVFLPAWEATPFLVFVMGLGFLAMGVKTLINVAVNIFDDDFGTDFHLLADKGFMPAIGWLIVFFFVLTVSIIILVTLCF